MSARVMLGPILLRPRKPARTDPLEAPSVGRVKRAIVQPRSQASSEESPLLAAFEPNVGSPIQELHDSVSPTR
jgi:hypothetical protein